MNIPRVFPSLGARPSRRGGSPRPRFAECERLESRCLLDAAAGTDLSTPSTFASEAEFRQSLIDTAVARVRSILGTSTSAPVGSGYYYPGMAMVLAAAPTSTLVPSSHSDTNNQVQGVDEGDIVENDGNDVYILSGRDLKIVDARHPDALTIASTTTIEGQPIAEYLNGSRLTILSSSDGYYPGAQGQTDTLPRGSFGWGIGGIVGAPIAMLPPAPGLFVAANVAVPAIVDEGTQGGYAPYSPRVKVTELDVSDPTQPSVVRQTTLDGTYINSRAVGNEVYLILQNNLPALPGPLTHADGTETVYETESEYRDRLATMVKDVTLPQYASQSTGQAAALGAQVEFHSIYKPESTSDDSLFTILTFDAGQQGSGPAASIGVVASSAATVYATPDHLDLLSPQWPAYGSSPDLAATTLIRRFTLDNAQVSLEAVGSVPGTVLNQYSVDEQGPYLRVATTETAAPAPMATTDPTVTVPPMSNSIYVMGEDQGHLSIVGSLTGIAQGERIYATRFFGDRAYVVTFRQFDPLFAIDLSDPTAPKLAGSLEIPGFSRYLQPIDATHLIGIGQQVANGEPSNVQVSLFDVSDLTDPRRLDVTTVSTGGSYWMTTSDHYDAHQVFYDPGTQTLAIPINGYSASAGTTDPTTLQDALWVFKVDPAKGLTQTGHVDAARPVERAVSLGDVLLSISQDAVKAVPLADPSTVLSQVQIRDPNEIPPSWGWGGILWPIEPDLTIKDPISVPISGPGSTPTHDRTPTIHPSTPGTPADPRLPASEEPVTAPADASGANRNANASTVGIIPTNDSAAFTVTGGSMAPSVFKATRGRHHHPNGPSHFHAKHHGLRPAHANHPGTIAHSSRIGALLSF